MRCSGPDTCCDAADADADESCEMSVTEARVSRRRMAEPASDQHVAGALAEESTVWRVKS